MARVRYSPKQSEPEPEDPPKIPFKERWGAASEWFTRNFYNYDRYSNPLTAFIGGVLGFSYRWDQYPRWAQQMRAESLQRQYPEAFVEPEPSYQPARSSYSTNPNFDDYYRAQMAYYDAPTFPPTAEPPGARYAAPPSSYNHGYAGSPSGPPIQPYAYPMPQLPKNKGQRVYSYDPGPKFSRVGDRQWVEKKGANWEQAHLQYVEQRQAQQAARRRT